MAIAQAQPAINTLFQIGNQGSPQTFNTIANVGDLTGPTMSSAVVDVTSHSNLSPWRSKIVTLIDNGDITIPLYFIPSSPGSDGQTNVQYGHRASDGLLAVFTGRQLREYKMVFPDPAATTWYFAGYISKFSMTAKVAGVLEAQVTFTFTSEPILA